MTDLIEVLARAYDPVGWAWYDKVTAAARETGATHPAAMGFFADKMLRSELVRPAPTEPDQPGEPS